MHARTMASVGTTDILRSNDDVWGVRGGINRAQMPFELEGSPAFPSPCLCVFTFLETAPVWFKVYVDRPGQVPTKGGGGAGRAQRRKPGKPRHSVGEARNSDQTSILRAQKGKDMHRRMAWAEP